MTTNSSITHAHFVGALEREIPDLVAVDSEGPPGANSNVSDQTIDEASSPWLPQRENESDGESPLRRTLARATTNHGSEGTWQPLVDRVRLASGKRVPGTRYRIVRWLGEGGMGMVFEALHVDIQRSVALKILKPGIAGARLQRDRFLDEARAVAQVDSRFVVDVLDFGELPDGRPFYTMELLEPVSLYDELRAGPLSLERAVPILRQCCKALAAVHLQALVHRDVKPQNILIQTEDGRTDAVRIVDFGIAAKFDSRPRVAGTALYMAPEQIRGVYFDGRLDIYGLGCVAYEMLTGAPPFAGASATELVQRHLDDPLVLPSARVPSLPPGVDAVLSKCLAKYPGDRYPTMHELEAALCEIQIAADFTTPWDDLPLPAVDDERRADLRRRMPKPRPERRRTHPLLLLGIGVLTVGLLSASAALLTEPRPSSTWTEPDAAMTAIQATTEAARVAGSRAYWAYPPSDQPGYPTALRMISALERERGPLRYLALARAQELREEFAATLVRLGDQYWRAPNGRPFAVEYYAQALLFDDSQPRALERTSLTVAQLADVATRVTSGDFSPIELEIAQVLHALAEPDPERRRDQVSALLADDTYLSTAIRFRSELSSLVGAERGSTPGSGGALAEQALDGVELANQADRARQADQADQIDQANQVNHANPGTAARSSTAPRTRIPTAAERRAQVQLERASAALARGDRDRAERMFAKALADNPQLWVAHAGLAEIHFARGHYQQAMSAARRAAQLRPDDASLLLLLGDSYVKIMRYDAARESYIQARALGHDKAGARLEQLAKVRP